MSARSALQAAIVARLGTVAGLRVFDAPPLRGGVPYAVVEEPVLQQADAVGIAGRTGTVSVVAHDAGERPVRLRALVAGVDAALETMAGDVGEGWRLVGVRLARSRLARVGDDRWRGVSEFAVRLYRES
ncbi:DUF3168 domain-containing protein [Sphingomonas ginsenosidivorax]|uniref:DUF3168 domain-containing protein n=1 Tax=Sphingomonas ginsenosidivorax TaxID=862135 RepID=A0A5C6UHJ4_9SPHN|nr:DUF3168 domain-containing protein [Sphingomonas ginsenosidivorax]TXC72159.1 DUF3168 domain-containing protein [Sphingomonas ginsenosidivorax]